jgi:PncC family amidohydrolase
MARRSINKPTDKATNQSINSLVEKIANTLIERGETVAFAESCTGGLLSAQFAALPGVSKIFLGSVVAYANEAKEHFLGVSGETLRAHGAVSSDVAIEMALGAQLRFGSTWAVSITGIAGPGGGTPEKPVGTVFIGLVGPELEQSAKKQFSGERQEIQKAAAESAFELLLAEFEA